MKKCFIELYLKRRGSQFSGDVNIISLLNEKGHCKGHDCIILFYDFDGFHENHRRLLLKNYYFRQKAMGCCCSKKQKLNVKIIDVIDKGPDFDY